MRIKRRVKVILEALKEDSKKKQVLEWLFSPAPGEQTEIGSPYYEIDDFVSKWSKEETKIKNIWENNYDLRLLQVLVVAEVIPNSPGMWYYKEDEDIIINAGILKPEEILFWGQNYDKNKNRLSETKWKLAKEMESGHLEAIIEDYKHNKLNVGIERLKIFMNELKKRKDLDSI